MSFLGKAAQSVRKATPDAPPITYSRPGYAPTSMMAGGNDPGAYMRAYGSSGTVYSIVSMLARQTAKKAWHLYRQAPVDGRVRYTTGDKGSDQRTEVVKHLAIQLWNKPNTAMSGFGLRELSQTYLDLTGESYLIVQRDPRATFPTALWPARPDRMEPIPGSDSFLAGYIYRGPSGEAVPLQPDEVLMTKYPNPFDIYHGLGPIQSILVDIDAAKYSAQWNRNFFLNSATPGGVIQVDKRLSDDEWNELTTRWRETHRGVGAAHRVAVLEQGAQWVANAHTIKDMDFASLRDVSRDVIREAFAMHKAILGTADDVNRANAQTAQELFEAFLVTDRLDRWRDTLNCGYLPLFGSTGDGVEMDHDDAVTSNREADAVELKSKADAALTLVTAGFDPKGVLETVGLPDMDVVEKATQEPALPPGWIATPSTAPADPAAPAQPDSDETPDGDGGYTSNRRRRAITAAATAPAPTDPAAIDLSEMDAQHTQATDALAADYQAQITPAQTRDLLDQIEQLVGAGTIGELGGLIVSYEVAKALILLALLGFGRTSADQAVREAARQGATGVNPVVPDAARLDAIAESAASLMATELSTAAGREATRVAGGTATPDPQVVSEHVATFLAGLSTAGPRAHLGGALAAAQNQARHGTFTAGPRCELVASEVNDQSTCEPCEQIDGTSFGYSDDPAAVDAAAAAYPTSGYIGCEGLERCRGALAAVYSNDSGDSSSGDDTTPNAALPFFLVDLNHKPAARNGHAQKVAAR